jgi:serpin B
VSDGTFTAADGTKQDAKMMHKEMHSYLKDDHAIGFMNRYKSHYAFAALLPEEGMTPEEYLAGLTPERLFKSLSEPVRSKNEVITGLPKFKYEFHSPLNDALINAGMQKAFQIKEADFSGMTDDPAGLYLSKVLHKTFIEVTPFGTRAGAGTFVDWAAGCIPDPEPKRIILSRPFVYLIFDMQTKLPLFIGTVNSIPNDPEEKE